jgi:microcystin-dependent protein
MIDRSVSLLKGTTMRSYLIIILLAGILGCAIPATASDEPFIGDIQCYAFNFCPVGWLECAGQTLTIVGNPALFSLMGITYGGNGTSNFMLPDLRGRHLVQAGAGPGLTARTQGQTGGSESHTLTLAEMAGHSHTLYAYPREADKPTASGNAWGKSGDGSPVYSTAGPTTTLRPDALAPSGYASPVPVDIRQPYLSLKCCIAVQGIFPPRP